MRSNDRRRRDKVMTDKACRLVLVRHALARGDGRFQGQRDVPLTAIGRRQLRALVDTLERYAVDGVYCSDLFRAHATAAALARRCEVGLEIRPNLREMHFGRWEGLSWTQVRQRFPRIARAWLTEFPQPLIPGGEPFADFKKRVAQELQGIVAANRGRCVVVVTHAGVIRIALGKTLGIKDRNLFRIAQAPCAVNVIDYFRGGVIVRCVNGGWN